VTDRTPSRPNLRFARGELVFGYRLIRKLGEGSFGSVWLAANDKGFEWALKIVHLGGGGGQKEFKALQLIKDRKINHTSLLKLIDYGLLDRDGTSLSPAVHKSLRSAAEIAVSDPYREVDNSQGPIAHAQGTMVPPAEKIPVSQQTAVEKVAARETQRESIGGDTTSDDCPPATWLVIVMEVGQLTLHQLQLQATQKDWESSPRQKTRAVTRMGVTAVVNGANDQATAVDPTDEPLVPLPVAQILPYMEQAARGLDYLHRHDIVHRDIKPQNIILVGDDAKVCDYGLASEFNNATATTIGCTPAYAAPEAINNRPVPASDQYSLAVTYIELVTGRWPFFGVTQTAIYREKEEGRHNLTFISNPVVRAVLKKALSKLPQDRYSTCTQFVEQLKIAENSRSVAVPRWLQIGVAAALLVLVSVVAIGWWGPSLAIGVASAWRHSPPVVVPPPDPRSDPDFDLAPEQLNAPLPLSGANSATLPENTPPIPEPSPAELADQQLMAALSQEGLSPAENFATFERWISKSEKQEFWWSELSNKAAAPTWHAEVERWLLANRVRRDQPEWLLDPAYLTFEMEQRGASLQRLLHLAPDSPDAMRQILAGNTLKLNDSHALAKLVELDLQMRLSSRPPTADDWMKWDGRIESALLQELSGLEYDQRRQFAMYLRCQRLGPGSSPKELKEAYNQLIELLDTEPLLTWLDRERKSRLAIPLGYVALNELGKTDRDLLAIDQFHLEKNKSFVRLLNVASAQGLESGSLDAAHALLQANQALESPAARAGAVDWQRIVQLAWNGLNHASTNDLLWNQQKRRLLAYVATYATLRANKPGTELFATAAKNLVTILMAKSTEGGQERLLYFDFAEKNQSHDAALYRHFVQPVLEHPGLTSETITKFDSGSLAKLWGVRGAILQRSPGVIESVGQQGDNKLSPSLQRLILQYRAFKQAQHFDALAQGISGGKPNSEYVAGVRRTLAAFPREDDALRHSISNIAALLREIDPVDIESHPELVRLDAHVRMQQALAERSTSRRRQLLQEGIQRYERLLSLSPAVDDRHHRATAHERLSELHWHISQLTDLQLADYRFTAAQSLPPPAGTKSFHLWQAHFHATRALAVADRPKKEYAYLLLANAQEQMATALGQLDQYNVALQTLKLSAGEVAAARRSASRLQSLYGHVQLRQGLELFSGLSQEDRIEKLHAAITSLTASLGDRQQTGNYGPEDAETLFGIAEAHLGLAQELPAERSLHWAAALAELPRAAAVGKDSLRIGHYRWRQLNLLAHQGIGTASDPSRAGRELANVILRDVLADPSGYDPVALFGIASQAGWLHYEKPATMLSWLPTTGPLARHWQSSDAARLEAIRLYCEAAVANDYDPSILARARQLEKNLERGSIAQRTAEALLQNCKARERCFRFETRKPAPATGGATENKQQDSRAAELVQAQLAINAIQECYNKYRDSLDEHVRRLVDQLHAATLDDIHANHVLSGLTVIEKRALWKYATTAPSLETRKTFVETCRAAQGASSGAGEPAAKRTELPALAQELLKPVLFFDDLKERDPRLEELIKLYEPPKEKEENKPAKS
jgi:serine/threonine protein kinase